MTPATALAPSAPSPAAPPAPRSLQRITIAQAAVHELYRRCTEDLL